MTRPVLPGGANGTAASATALRVPVGPVGDDVQVPDEPTFSGSPAGLCGTCRRALIRPTRRGPTYLRCGLATSDGRFPKYPRLPVLECAGYAGRDA